MFADRSHSKLTNSPTNTNFAMIMNISNHTVRYIFRCYPAGTSDHGRKHVEYACLASLKTPVINTILSMFTDRT